MNTKTTDNTVSTVAEVVAERDQRKADEQAMIDCALEQSAAAASELDGNAEPTITKAACDILAKRHEKYAVAGEYLVSLGKGSLGALIKAFTPPKSATKLLGWSAPAMPAGLKRVKIVAYQYGVRDIIGTGDADTDPTKGVHSTRYTLRLTFAAGDKFLPDYAAHTGFGGEHYAVGPARLDKMVGLWGLMREAWGLNAKGEPKK